MKWVDGDSALLVFFIVVGGIPVLGDALHDRAFGALTTVALTLTVLSAVGLAQRALLFARARWLRQKLLTAGRWPR